MSWVKLCKVHTGKILSSNIFAVNLKCMFGQHRCLRTLPSKRGSKSAVESQIDQGENATAETRFVDARHEQVETLLKDAATFDDKPQSVDDVWSTSIYPINVDKRRDQTQHSFRPQTDPRDTSIILFPGQGTQFVGMGRNTLDYPNVKDMYEVAGEILKYDLLDLCLYGPKEKLDRTVYCQPAVLVTSLAAVEKLKDEKPHVVESCVAAAGFSIGEIAALVFAGALAFEDAVRIVKIRAEAMQAASELIPSGMMTVFLHPDAKINFACKAATEWCFRKGIEGAVCSVANYLFPSCKVIAGNKEALEFIEINAKDFGIKKYKHLAVSGAFHTNLMYPAKKPLYRALTTIKINDPLISVHSNLDGKPYKNGQQIVQQLSNHICAPVKWEQTLHIIYERSQEAHFPNSFECGPGKSLKTILKMVNSKAAAVSYSVDV